MNNEVREGHVSEPDERSVRLRERRLELELVQLERAVVRAEQEQARPWIRRRWVVQSILTALASVPLVWFYFERVAIPATRTAAMRSEWEGLKLALDNERAREQLQSERNEARAEARALAQQQDQTLKALGDLEVQLSGLQAENALMAGRLRDVAGSDKRIRALEARLASAEEDREELAEQLVGLRVERDDAIERLATLSAARAVSLDQAIASTEEQREAVRELSESVGTSIRTRPLEETYGRALGYQVDLGDTSRIRLRFDCRRSRPPRYDFEEPCISWAAIDIGEADDRYEYVTRKEVHPDTGTPWARDVVHLGTLAASEIAGNNVGVRATHTIGFPNYPGYPYYAATLEVVDTESGRVLWSSREISDADPEYAVTLHFAQ